MRSPLTAAVWFNEVTVRPTGELLPAWATGHVSLGAGVVSYRAAPNSLVVAVALPTRAYAAAFVACGVVLQCAATQTAPSLDAHVDHLLALVDREGPVPVRIIYGQNMGMTGLFEGLEDLTDGLYLKVVASKSLRKLLPFDQALRIQPIGQLKHSGLVKPIVAKGRDFIGSILGAVDSVQYLTTSRLECVIVGPEGRICKEIEDRIFQSAPHVGSLQDVLRVRRYCSPGDSYRCEVISDRSAAAIEGEKPNVVIFDGAAAYLKCRHDWRGSPWIVILDQTETQFEDAVSQVNADYLQRIGDAGLLDLPGPASVDGVAFEVKGP